MKTTKPIRRKFCGIWFTRTLHNVWRSEDGIELHKCTFSKMERWSVEESPRGRSHRGSGMTIEEALKNSGLLPEQQSGALKRCYGRNETGTWMAYTDRTRTDGISWGPFETRQLAAEFIATNPAMYAVNMTDYPRWFNV